MAKTYYHAVMFDFDGTLVGTMHDYARIASEEITKLYGIDAEISRQVYLETSGVPFFQQLNMIFGEDPRNAECAEHFERRKASLLENVKLDANTREILARIRSFGLSIAITSNNFQYLLDRFVANEPKLFDLILGFGNGLSKGPSQFTRVLDTFGVDRRHILFVGDSLSDVRKALAFGIDIVAMAGTLCQESFTSLFPKVPVISTLLELEELLEGKIPVAYKLGKS